MARGRIRTWIVRPADTLRTQCSWSDRGDNRPATRDARLTGYNEMVRHFAKGKADVRAAFVGLQAVSLWSCCDAFYVRGHVGRRRKGACGLDIGILHSRSRTVRCAGCLLQLCAHCAVLRTCQSCRYTHGSGKFDFVNCYVFRLPQVTARLK